MSNDNKKEAPETISEKNPAFSASDMEKRANRLKKAGKMPPLADVLKALKSAASKS